MPRPLALLQPSAVLARTFPFTVFLASACSGGAPALVDAGARDLAVGSADLAAMPADFAIAPDLRPYDPPNPLGRGPAPVDIGTSTNLAAAGSYVLLAKTGITNTTGSMITGGNLGLSPAAASLITSFSLIADPTNVYSTSVAVAAPGKVYASSYATPTPANLTSAIASMQAAYTDAAGRTNPDSLNLDNGNIGGATLPPGLYTWGSSVNIAADVTILGGVNDVWIFQISNDLDLSSAKSVTVSGGAQAKNIFWQVAGQVTVHPNAHFEGVILAKTAITLQTTATLHGRALAQSLVAIDNNAITAP